MDPQNFGAIIRSAHCLGVSGILACSRNCAPLSAAVSKASAGVLEVLRDEDSNQAVGMWLKLTRAFLNCFLSSAPLRSRSPPRVVQWIS